MKYFSEKTVTSETLDEIRCNQCGRHIRKNAFGHFEDYFSYTKTWGYDSPLDGETHNVDLCIACYLQWIEAFQLPARETAGQ